MKRDCWAVGAGGCGEGSVGGQGLVEEESLPGVGN